LGTAAILHIGYNFVLRPRRRANAGRARPQPHIAINATVSRLSFQHCDNQIKFSRKRQKSLNVHSKMYSINAWCNAWRAAAGLAEARRPAAAAAAGAFKYNGEGVI
jgi:hypothetical protein